MPHTAPDTILRWIRRAAITLALAVQPVAQPSAADEAADLCDNRLRLFGGCTVSISKFPWQVSIGERGLSRLESHRCGGSLIARRWVLTAAHCVIGESAAGLEVYWGSGHLEHGGETVRAKNLFIPDGSMGVTGEDDIALIELADEVSARPARLAAPGSDDSLYAFGRETVLVGWGMTAQSGKSGYDDPNDFALSRQLRGAVLPIVGADLCDEGGDESVVCAGYAELVADACRGDSGGPLHARRKRDYVQIGVVSGGEGCGAEGDHYGTYTRVSAYRDWIGRVMRGAVAPATASIDETLLIALEPGDETTFGAIGLDGGFGPSPHSVTLTAGGELDAGWIKDGCVGSVAKTPDFNLIYEPAENVTLMITVDGEADTTLLIRDPAGFWYCNDDQSDSDRRPRLRWSTPPAGRYSIFVGSYESGALPEVTLQISDYGG